MGKLQAEIKSLKRELKEEEKQNDELRTLSNFQNDFIKMRELELNIMRNAQHVLRLETQIEHDQEELEIVKKRIDQTR